MIGVLLIVVELVARAVFLAVLLVGPVFCAWLLWDITAGPSARDAAARARAGRRRVGGA